MTKNTSELRKGDLAVYLSLGDKFTTHPVPDNTVLEIISVPVIHGGYCWVCMHHGPPELLDFTVYSRYLHPLTGEHLATELAK